MQQAVRERIDIWEGGDVLVVRGRSNMANKVLAWDSFNSRHVVCEENGIFNAETGRNAQKCSCCQGEVAKGVHLRETEERAYTHMSQNITRCLRCLTSRRNGIGSWQARV